MKKVMYRLGLLLLVLLPLSSQAQSQIPVVTATYVLAGFVLLVAIIVLIVLITVLQVLRVILRKETEKKAELAGEVIPEPLSWWSRLMQSANDAVPIEKEETVMLDHNYDGIRELDNHLPPWWKWLFYFSIAFAVIYLFIYHIAGILPLSTDEYRQEIARAEAIRAEQVASQPVAQIDESNVVYLDDPESLAKGALVFKRNCQQCHREDGGGNIGPNLTDEYWLHGGSIQDIFRTIKQGAPDKGMISWEPLLSPDQMQNVASFVMSLRGSGPPNAKAPQGERYSPDRPVEQESADSIQSVAIR